MQTQIEKTSKAKESLTTPEARNWVDRKVGIEEQIIYSKGLTDDRLGGRGEEEGLNKGGALPIPFLIFILSLGIGGRRCRIRPPIRPGGHQGRRRVGFLGIRGHNTCHAYSIVVIVVKKGGG